MRRVEGNEGGGGGGGLVVVERVKEKGKKREEGESKGTEGWEERENRSQTCMMQWQL